MGKNTLIIENDSIEPRKSCPADDPAVCQTILIRGADREANATKKLSPDEQLKSALAPFQRMLTLERQLEENAPQEQKKLLLCMKANGGNSLECHKEIHDFAAFVNKLALGTPSGRR